jgi:Transglycosylase SLT domain
MNVSHIGTGCIMFVSGLAAVPLAHANCFDDAAAYQHVNPLILRAIAWQESHNHVDAVHVNANGSIDYGLMQINTIHLPALARYGIGKDALMSPCKNVYIAAWQLRRQVLKYGNTWAAVGAYHSATPVLRDEYARQIAGILRRWHVLPEDRSGERTARRLSALATNRTGLDNGRSRPAESEAKITQR